MATTEATTEGWLGDTMKAIVQRAYGLPDVLEFQDVDPPVAAADEVLVRVRAASVNPYDWHQMTGTPYLVRLGGLRAPKQAIRGMDLSGEVAAVGSRVTRFRPGDEVFGIRRGAFAEYLTAPAEQLVRKPAELAFEQAAAVPMAALTALQGLRTKGRIRPGQRVLINGASGGVGTFAVQLAKSFGTDVTAVCSTRNVATARSLGADHVIDYTREDFAAGGHRYDLMLDIAGNRSFADRRRVLDPAGTLVVVSGPKTNRWVGPMAAMLRAAVQGRVGRPRMVGLLTSNSATDLAFLAGLLAAGAVRPVIERTYPLPAAPDALRYLGAGHAQGKIVITV